MSVVAEPGSTPEEQGARRTWTLADVAVLPEQLPTGPAMYEVWDGELRIMPPTGEVHGSLESRLSGVLLIHGEWEGHGRVAGGEVGVVIDTEPTTLFGADVVFCSSDQLPIRRSPEGYLLTAPAIVAEVRSKNDTVKEIRQKVQRYLDAGVRLVWVADAEKQTITAHRAGAEPQVLSRDDVLTAEGIIPSLQFPIRRLFEGLESE